MIKAAPLHGTAALPRRNTHSTPFAAESVIKRTEQTVLPDMATKPRTDAQRQHGHRLAELGWALIYSRITKVDLIISGSGEQIQRRLTHER